VPAQTEAIRLWPTKTIDHIDDVSVEEAARWEIHFTDGTVAKVGWGSTSYGTSGPGPFDGHPVRNIEG
jgi:hypothetical protein